MTKANIFLLLVSTLFLGAVIGSSFVSVKSEPSVSESSAELSKRTETGASERQDRGGAPLFRYLKPGDLNVELDEFGRSKPSAIAENYIAQSGAWHSEVVNLVLEEGAQVEYKAIMNQGGSVVFDWVTDGNDLYFDFHGHDAAFGDQFFVRYEHGDAKKQSGAIVAAFSGEHGWYWQNLGEGATKVTLRVSGFFDKIIKIDVGAE
jgi:hypothetical protein